MQYAVVVYFDRGLFAADARQVVGARGRVVFHPFRAPFYHGIVDGVAQRVEAVHADAVGIPADDEPDAVGLFAAPDGAVEQHADDFIVFVQVDMGDFALGTVHGAGVNLIAPAQQFGNLLGEGAVDIVLIHDKSSSRFQSQAKSMT